MNRAWPTASGLAAGSLSSRDRAPETRSHPCGPCIQGVHSTCCRSACGPGSRPASPEAQCQFHGLLPVLRKTRQHEVETLPEPLVVAAVRCQKQLMPAPGRGMGDIFQQKTAQRLDTVGCPLLPFQPGQREPASEQQRISPDGLPVGIHGPGRSMSRNLAASPRTIQAWPHGPSMRFRARICGPRRKPRRTEGPLQKKQADSDASRRRGRSACRHAALSAHRVLKPGTHSGASRCSVSWGSSGAPSP